MMWPLTPAPPIPSGSRATRLTGYYESCSPSPTEPDTIRLLGNDFDVLTTAQATLAKFRPGDQITLLLTEDNKVAGAVKPGTAGATANAIGIASSISGTSATVDLPCGIQIKGSVNLESTGNDSIDQARREDLARMQNRLERRELCDCGWPKLFHPRLRHGL